MDRVRPERRAYDLWFGGLLAAVGSSVRPALVLAVFAAYGALWGPYLAANLPDVRRATGADDATLGAALLVGAVAAVPAMLAAGRLLDRFGRPVAVGTLGLFAVAAPAPALAGSAPGLVLALGLFGLGSGACNVVVVALAAAAESGSGARLMCRAHALFSVGVLVCATGTGAARGAGVAGRDVAVALSVGLAVAVLAARRRLPHRFSRPAGRFGVRPTARPGSRRPAALLCLLAALAMVVESGVQNWSAVFLADVLRAGPALAALAPGVFAGAMALGRLGGHWLSGRAGDRAMLLGSGLLSASGVLLLAAAATPGQGLAGTAIVGAAGAAVVPTVYARVCRGISPERRGHVLGAATSIASTGLMVGPALVGQLAGHTGLRVAVASLTVLSAAFCLLALRVCRPADPSLSVSNGRSTAAFY